METTFELNAEEPAASLLTAIVRPDSVDTDYEGDLDFDGGIEQSFLGSVETLEIRSTFAF